MSSILNKMPSALTGSVDKVKSILFNKNFLIIMVVVAIFLGVAFYVYNTYIAPKINPDFVPNREFTTDGEGDNNLATLYFFGVDWCPYSKKAKPHWEQFKERYDSQIVNNHKILCKEYDCDKNEKMCDKYNVEGYPTIKMLKNDQIIDFDAKPTIENLTKFVETAI